MQNPFGSIASLDFLGKNGFVWFVGIVVRNDDPLKLGRARVRIFGYHNLDNTLLPNEELPWAHAVSPLGNSTSPKSPPIGTWVIGFFLDGEMAQQPVMLGAINGFRQKDLIVETVA